MLYDEKALVRNINMKICISNLCLAVVKYCREEDEIVFETNYISFVRKEIF